LPRGESRHHHVVGGVLERFEDLGEEPEGGGGDPHRQLQRPAGHPRREQEPGDPTRSENRQGDQLPVDSEVELDPLVDHQQLVEGHHPEQRRDTQPGRLLDARERRPGPQPRGERGGQQQGPP
jgi:hypothetical protein